MRQILTTTSELVGGALVVAGVAQLSVAGAYIVAGALLIVGGVFSA